MDKKLKIGVIILAMLFLLSLTGAIIEFSFFQKEKLKVITVREELQNLEVEKRIVEGNLTKSKQMIDELNNQLETVQKQIEELTSTL